MHPVYRLLTTLVIWLAVVGIVAIIFLSSAGASAAEHVEVILGTLGILSLAAGFGTTAVWRGATSSPALSEAEVRAARKAKAMGSGRFDRLSELLDEDELVELETLLLAREDKHLSSS